jgi:hypothetical protein
MSGVITGSVKNMELKRVYDDQGDQGLVCAKH